MIITMRSERTHFVKLKASLSANNSLR